MRPALHLIATLVLLAACSKHPGDTPSVESGVPDSSTDLSLELRAEKLEYRVGETFRFTAEMVNAGSVPMTVVLPGDGSEVGWRTPIVRWTPPLRSLRRCGNINRALPHELVVLQPLQSLVLNYSGLGPVFEVPGACAVSLELEHDPKIKQSEAILCGLGDPATAERISRLPPYRVKSNTVQVIVRE